MIEFSDAKSTKIPAIEQALSLKDTIIPEWLEKRGTVGKLVAEPSTERMAQQINIRLVIEFYSR